MPTTKSLRVLSGEHRSTHAGPAVGIQDEGPGVASGSCDCSCSNASLRVTGARFSPRVRKMMAHNAFQVCSGATPARSGWPHGVASGGSVCAVEFTLPSYRAVTFLTDKDDISARGSPPLLG